MTLTQDIVKELFDYHEDGYLTWKVNRGTNKVKGRVAGSFDSYDGYYKVSIGHVKYKLHRVIYLWHNEHLPKEDIDHEDKDPSNNKINNLRPLSKTGNAINQNIYSNNTSGVKGVCADKNKWKAYIIINKKFINLGRYKNFIDAVKARYKAELKYEFNKYNNNSSAYIYLKENNIAYDS